MPKSEKFDQLRQADALLRIVLSDRDDDILASVARLSGGAVFTVR